MLNVYLISGSKSKPISKLPLVIAWLISAISAADKAEPIPILAFPALFSKEETVKNPCGSVSDLYIEPLIASTPSAKAKSV